jgi:hypothetical protein
MKICQKWEDGVDRKFGSVNSISIYLKLGLEKVHLRAERPALLLSLACQIFSPSYTQHVGEEYTRNLANRSENLFQF